MVVKNVMEAIQAEVDLSYEEDLSRNPFSLKLWWRYISSRRDAKAKVKYTLYERAVKNLPGSYKLWHAYLTDRRMRVRGKEVSSKAYEIVNNTFERALITMNKMPVIWLDYCKFLMEQKLITKTRQTFDRALIALPITQHHRVWKLYLEFIHSAGVKETAVRVYRRYIQLEPQAKESYVDYLLSVKLYDEAATQLVDIVNDDKFISENKRSKHSFWMMLCDICSKYPLAIKSVKPEVIIRSGIRKYPDETGHLWCKLADFFIRKGSFEKARDVFEEGISCSMTVRDFSLVFDAYSMFEESMLNAKMEVEEDDEAEEEDEDELNEDGDDIEYRMERFQNLIDRRPLLLSSVLLRQNPNNVHEWNKRCKLYTDPIQIVNCYKEAVSTVDPSKAVGKLHVMWITYAKFYEEHEDIENADAIFEKATQVNFKKINDLATIWTEWAEMHLRHDGLDRALSIMQTAVKVPSRKKIAERATKIIQDVLYKSTKAWSFYIDLEESLGTVESTKTAYEKMIDLKVATPKTILNMCNFLEENNYFEESYRAYEKGISLFDWPHVKDIWINYLSRFVKRYKATKLERARDLFEQCLSTVPPQDAKTIYIMYSQLEEEHGLTRHCMSILDRATMKVSQDDQLAIFLYYISKVEEYYGITKTREVYEKGIEVLNDAIVWNLCLKYADTERKLGEIDRARGIYTYASQFCNPRTVISFWKKWSDFEVAHGNEDTFRDMLRIQRTVEVTFSLNQTDASGLVTDNIEDGIKSDAEALIQEAIREGKDQGDDEIISTNARVEVKQPITGVKRKADVGGSIDADMEALERAVYKGKQKEKDHKQLDYDESGDIQIESVSVPKSVFGSAGDVMEKESAGAENKGGDKKEKVGALARFKKK